MPRFSLFLGYFTTLDQLKEVFGVQSDDRMIMNCRRIEKECEATSHTSGRLIYVSSKQYLNEEADLKLRGRRKEQANARGVMSGV